MSAPKIIALIREERRKIWDEEPDDIKRLLRTKGTFDQNCMPTLYAESETRQLVDFLYCLRAVAKKEETTLESMESITSVVLDLFAAKCDRWYHMFDTTRLLKDAISEIDHITDKTQYVILLEELLLYVGRLNFWIELRIPWYGIIGTYEWLVRERP